VTQGRVSKVEVFFFIGGVVSVAILSQVVPPPHREVRSHFCMHNQHLPGRIYLQIYLL
jgi:hypothetical protein